MMCAGREGEGGQRQNMTLLAERTQRHIVFPSEMLALILHGLCGAAGCWGVLPARSGCRQVWQEQGAWKAPGTWCSGRSTQEPTAVAWTGTEGSGVWEPPVKPAVPGCPGSPHGRCWVQTAAGGPGS